MGGEVFDHLVKIVIRDLCAFRNHGFDLCLPLLTRPACACDDVKSVALAA